MDKFNIGNIVVISALLTDHKKIGIVSDPRGKTNYTWSTDATCYIRIPVLFPKDTLPHWFDGHYIRHANEAECKIYFKDRLRYGK